MRRPISSTLLRMCFCPTALGARRKWMARRPLRPSCRHSSCRYPHCRLCRRHLLREGGAPSFHPLGPIKACRCSLDFHVDAGLGPTPTAPSVGGSSRISRGTPLPMARGISGAVHPSCSGWPSPATRSTTDARSGIGLESTSQQRVGTCRIWSGIPRMAQPGRSRAELRCPRPSSCWPWISWRARAFTRSPVAEILRLHGPRTR